MGSSSILISETVASSVPALGTKVTKTYSSSSASRSSKTSVIPYDAPLVINILWPGICGTCAKVPTNSLEVAVVWIPSSTSFTNTSNLKNFSLLNLIPFKTNISVAFSFSSSLLVVAGLFTRTFTLLSNFTGNSVSSAFFTDLTDLSATLDALTRGIGGLSFQGMLDASYMYPILFMSTQSLL
ncbi:hypothetical protein HanPI659440_Chr03g0118191 [Helianthus annuus]|nr:hypothetical protein HanPI659440_Chr03g0118191 [Helianthus annuus]